MDIKVQEVVRRSFRVGSVIRHGLRDISVEPEGDSVLITAEGRGTLPLSRIEAIALRECLARAFDDCPKGGAA